MQLSSRLEQSIAVSTLVLSANHPRRDPIVRSTAQRSYLPAFNLILEIFTQLGTYINVANRNFTYVAIIQTQPKSR